MENVKWIKFLLFTTALTFASCPSFLSCNCMRAISCHSLVNDCIMTLTDSTDTYLVFSQKVKINNRCHKVRCIYTDNEANPIFQIINGIDTLAFEKNALFICDTFADLNKDDFDDWILKSITTQGTMDEIHYYLPKEKRFNPIADTILYGDCPN